MNQNRINEIVRELVERHKELKSYDQTPGGYGQDDEIYNSLDELEKEITKNSSSKNQLSLPLTGGSFYWNWNQPLGLQ